MHLRRIKILAILVPILGLLGFELFRHLVLQPGLGEETPHLEEHIVSAVLLLAAVIGFSLWIFSHLERLHDQLLALNEAGIELTGDLSVDRQLERVAHLARTVGRASYASIEIETGNRRSATSGTRSGTRSGVGAGETLSLPIVVKGERLGTLTLADPRGGRFHPSDPQALETFATQVGVALENARLFEQVHDLAAMRERVRISMDLHDGLIQELYAVGLKVEDASQLVLNDPDEATTRMREVHDIVRTVIGDVRTYVYGLQDGDRSVDLRPAFEHLAAGFQPGAPVFVLDLEGDSWLPAAVAGNVLHIVREAVANAVRHADASHITIRSVAQDGRLLISVEDDGRGFDLLAPPTGLGLGDMQERAAWCRGEVLVDPMPGRGTTVRLSVPVPEAAPKAYVP